MIKITHRGDFRKLNSYFQRQLQKRHISKLDSYGKRGVEALQKATPKDTGKTADSWRYDYRITDESISLTWYNDNYNNGVPIAIILQYGHATGTGGWVEGRDYINPAMQPIFDKIAED